VLKPTANGLVEGGDTQTVSKNLSHFLYNGFGNLKSKYRKTSSSLNTTNIHFHARIFLKLLTLYFPLLASFYSFKPKIFFFWVKV